MGDYDDFPKIRNHLFDYLFSAIDPWQLKNGLKKHIVLSVSPIKRFSHEYRDLQNLQYLASPECI